MLSSYSEYLMDAINMEHSGSVDVALGGVGTSRTCFERHDFSSLREGSVRSSKQTLHGKPFAEEVDPVVDGQASLGHSERVSALGVDVQLCRMAGGFPSGVQIGAPGGRHKWIV